MTNLNFTKLNGISVSALKDSEDNLKGMSNMSKSSKSSARYPKIETEREQLAKGLEEARKIHWEYAENTMKTDQLRIWINKAVNEGKSVLDILLKALECIALMTNDPHFFERNKCRLEANVSGGSPDV